MFLCTVGKADWQPVLLLLEIFHYVFHLFRYCFQESIFREPLHLLLDYWSTHWQIWWFKNLNKETFKNTWYSFAMWFPSLSWSLHCLCSLWWSCDYRQPQSGLCLIYVPPICSRLAFLPSHNIPTIADTTTCYALFEFCTFTKHLDLKSQSEICHHSLKSLMKRFCCLQSVEQFNWRLTDISSDGSASHLKVVSVDLSELKCPGEIT